MVKKYKFSQEQEKVINAPIDVPLIVNGVPGSGKTLLAFERIKHLINKEGLNNNEIVFLSSNNFLLDYISKTYSEETIKKINKYTFEDFAFKVLEKKIRLIEEKEKIISFYDRKILYSNKENLDLKINESKFKSSLKYKELIDKYLDYYGNKLIPKRDFILANVRIIKSSTVRELFFEKYKELSIEERLDKIKEDIFLKIQQNAYDIIKQTIEKRAVDVQQLMKKDLSIQQIKSQKNKIFGKTEKLLQMLYKSDPKIVDLYFGEIKLKNARIRYRDFVDNFVYDNIEDKKLGSFLVDESSPYLEKSAYKFDDLPAIIYMHLKIFKSNISNNLKHIVIDNIQDYGEFQFFILKEILKSNSFSLFGDITQGLFFYRGINDLEIFKEEQFPENKLTYIKLKETYTLDKEIMELSNRILRKLPEDYKKNITFVETKIKELQSLKIYSALNYENIARECARKIRTIEKDDTYKSLAIIGRDMKECRSIRKAIGNYVYEPTLIENTSLINNSKCFVIPAYLTKGMKFDYTIIVNASNKNYIDDILDIKSLYVAVTRANKNLDIYFVKNISNLMIE